MKDLFSILLAMQIFPQPSPGGGSWGTITGTLSDQTDLQSALNSKANNIIYSQDTEPVLTEDGTFAFWEKTDTNKRFLILRDTEGYQTLVELT
jgi:hypothetical protein